MCVANYRGERCSIVPVRKEKSSSGGKRLLRDDNGTLSSKRGDQKRRPKQEMGAKSNAAKTCKSPKGKREKRAIIFSSSIKRGRGSQRRRTGKIEESPGAGRAGRRKFS